MQKRPIAASKRSVAGDKLHVAPARLGHRLCQFPRHAPRGHRSLSRSVAGKLLRKRTFVAARPLVPAGALAWSWISLDFAHKSEQLKPLFALPANFFPFQVLFGGLLDSLRRSPYLVVAVEAGDGGATLSLRLPGGTKGMRDWRRAHAPPAGEPGACPLLEPEGVLYQQPATISISQILEATCRAVAGRSVGQGGGVRQENQGDLVRHAIQPIPRLRRGAAAARGRAAKRARLCGEAGDAVAGLCGRVATSRAGASLPRRSTVRWGAWHFWPA